jgi:pilus assembly protein CpaB
MNTTGRFGGVHSAGGGDRAKIMVAAGLVLILTLGGLGALFLTSEPQEATARTVVVEKEAEIKMVDVLVPIRNIEAGVALEPSMFRRESRPQVGVSGRTIQDFEKVKGYYARSLIIPGQPLHEDYITNVRPTNIITAKIPEGYRAVTIRVDARSSVEGWARSGAKVDVVWSSTVRGKQAVTTIVQNAEVLSAERQVDTNVMPGAAVPSTVTLLVTQQDSARIQLASNTGSLSLSLRGDGDAGKGTSASSITIDDLLGRAPVQQQSECEGTMKVGDQEYCIKRGGGMELRSRAP